MKTEKTNSGKKYIYVAEYLGRIYKVTEDENKALEALPCDQVIQCFSSSRTRIGNIHEIEKEKFVRERKEKTVLQIVRDNEKAKEESDGRGK